MKKEHFEQFFFFFYKTRLVVIRFCFILLFEMICDMYFRCVVWALRQVILKKMLIWIMYCQCLHTSYIMYCILDIESEQENKKHEKGENLRARSNLM